MIRLNPCPFYGCLEALSFSFDIPNNQTFKYVYLLAAPHPGASIPGKYTSRRTSRPDGTSWHSPPKPAPPRFAPRVERLSSKEKTRRGVSVSLRRGRSFRNGSLQGVSDAYTPFPNQEPTSPTRNAPTTTPVMRVDQVFFLLFAALLAANGRAADGAANLARPASDLVVGRLEEDHTDRGGPGRSDDSRIASDIDERNAASSGARYVVAAQW